MSEDEAPPGPAPAVRRPTLSPEAETPSAADAPPPQAPPHGPLAAPGDGARALLAALRADHARLGEEHGGRGGRARLLRDALWHKTFRALAAYRIERAARRGRGPWRLLRLPAALWRRHAHLSAGLEIAWAAEIGPGCRILHGFGVVILPCARIGAGVTLCMGAGVGARDRPGPDGRHASPGEIEDGGFIGPYSMVWARLGRGGVLASHSALTRPAPPSAIMAGAPARRIGWREEEGASEAAPGPRSEAPPEGRPEERTAPRPDAPHMEERTHRPEAASGPGSPPVSAPHAPRRPSDPPPEAAPERAPKTRERRPAGGAAENLGDASSDLTEARMRAAPDVEPDEGDASSPGAPPEPGRGALVCAAPKPAAPRAPIFSPGAHALGQAPAARREASREGAPEAGRAPRLGDGSGDRRDACSDTSKAPTEAPRQGGAGDGAAARPGDPSRAGRDAQVDIRPDDPPGSAPDIARPRASAPRADGPAPDAQAETMPAEAPDEGPAPPPLDPIEADGEARADARAGPAPDAAPVQGTAPQTSERPPDAPAGARPEGGSDDGAARRSDIPGEGDRKACSAGRPAPRLGAAPGPRSGAATSSGRDPDDPDAPG